MKVTGVLILIAFYSVYFGKMLLQHKKGIRTNQMATGSLKDRVFYQEAFLKAITVLIVVIEFISIFMVKPAETAVFGAVLGVSGIVVFFLAVYAMKDSWRAGLAREDKTRIITGGIYAYSRNPAFLGFYLVYTGLLLMFFNWPLFAITIIAIAGLHNQILQEEKHLSTVFGAEYMEYKQGVNRYLGRKRGHKPM